jgi:hypothetical protein
VEAPSGFRPVWMINVTRTKFRYLDERFESLGSGMTRKLRDREWTLLFCKLEERSLQFGTASLISARSGLPDSRAWKKLQKSQLKPNFLTTVSGNWWSCMRASMLHELTPSN